MNNLFYSSYHENFCIEMNQTLKNIQNEKLNNKSKSNNNAKEALRMRTQHVAALLRVAKETSI